MAEIPTEREFYLVYCKDYCRLLFVKQRTTLFFSCFVLQREKRKMKQNKCRPKETFNYKLFSVFQTEDSGSVSLISLQLLLNFNQLQITSVNMYRFGMQRKEQSL